MSGDTSSHSTPLLRGARIKLFATRYLYRHYLLQGVSDDVVVSSRLVSSPAQDKVYIFGGEYATLDNFHHYRDFWELDLKTSVWVELKTSGDVPSARSGHR